VTVEDIANLGRKKLLSIVNIGQVTVDDIITMLRKVGLELKE